MPISQKDTENFSEKALKRMFGKDVPPKKAALESDAESLAKSVGKSKPKKAVGKKDITGKLMHFSDKHKRKHG